MGTSTDRLSNWIEEKEKRPNPPTTLQNEWDQIAQETDSFFKVSEQLQSAYSEVLEKVNHVRS